MTIAGFASQIVKRGLYGAAFAIVFSCPLAVVSVGLAQELDYGNSTLAFQSPDPMPVAGDRDADFDFPHVGLSLPETGPFAREQPPVPDPRVARVPMLPTVKPVADTTAPRPRLQVSYPGPSAKGSQSIQISAVDDDPMIEGAVLIDGNIVASFSAASFTYEWDTTRMPDGPHLLVAKVEDSAGNVGTSTPVTVNVNNGDTAPPNVYVAYPASGTNVYGDHVVNITAGASDDVGVSRVDFYIDTTRICSITSKPYTCAWQVPDGETAMLYRIRVQAFDTRDNTTSSSVTVFPPTASSRVAANVGLGGPPRL
jgi:hypothetical protein